MFQGNVRKIATVLTASDQASSKLDSAEKAGDDVADSMEQAEQRTDALTSAFTRSAAATAALAGTMGLLTRQHGETEQTFSRLQVVAGATNEEMRELQSTAMQMGVDLPIAMGDAAEAMEQLAFAGFEAQEAVSAANGVANLAVASGMNMSQSARTAASTLRMFNMEAEETHQVTSTMAAVFSNSATTIDELSSALEMTGSTAAAAGIEMQEVAAAVGVLADQGIRASRAGTALNTTLQRITTGSGQAEQALSDLGLSTEDFVDEAGEIEDLETMLNTIGAEMEELETDSDRLAVATELAGQRGARALLPLLENTDELNQKMGDIMRSEIRESIGEINRLTDEELAEVENVLDMDVDREDFTPRELVGIAPRGVPRPRHQLHSALQEELAAVRHPLGSVARPVPLSRPTHRVGPSTVRTRVDLLLPRSQTRGRTKASVAGQTRGGSDRSRNLRGEGRTSGHHRPRVGSRGPRRPRNLRSLQGTTGRRGGVRCDEEHARGGQDAPAGQRRRPGFLFLTFLALRVYFRILKRLREKELTGEISVREVLYELSKVQLIVEEDEDREYFAKIPKQARDVGAHFPECLPMG